jgi:hypothetical protein
MSHFDTSVLSSRWDSDSHHHCQSRAFGGLPRSRHMSLADSLAVSPLEERTTA